MTDKADKIVQGTSGARVAYSLHGEYDVNKDGFIDMEEVVNLALTLGLSSSLPHDKILLGARAIDSIDTNRDEKISLEEFQAAVPILNTVTWLSALPLRNS